ncbi:unnamed protein product [Arabidopsis thaliana]|uniref:(thale cress) hypothetical protein n=1 Tax=Arabidopsis thaliana TaxID=3702 RepID=A0A7G2ESI0_ARATH|nr:unnamed protein product [Arabidopsis thaliana]
MWNNLTGRIPLEIGRISSLKLLLLNGNKFTGSLPPELGNLQNLNRLQVDENNITGSVPFSFGNLRSIKHLHLNNNTISGEIPVELSKLPKLVHMILDNNNLTGTLPLELAQLPSLTILQLDNNNFEGSTIPEAYGHFSRLVKLSLRNCGLQGSIPDLSRIENLSYLNNTNAYFHLLYRDLSWNHLTGTIPESKLSDNMTTIELSYNHLTGSIPQSFSDLNSLQLLSLENNSLSGSVPTEIWQDKSFENNKLQVDLRNNNFSDATGNLRTPDNVTLYLRGNPICKTTSIPMVTQFFEYICGEKKQTSTNSNTPCSNVSCPFENVKVSPGICLCTAPLSIDYRLKSPSFFFFTPYIERQFREYITSSLQLETHQLAIDRLVDENRLRPRMYLKLVPKGRITFNKSEVIRIRDRFMSWSFNKTDFFGPYELLDFPLQGPYADLLAQTSGIRTIVWMMIVAGSVVAATVLSVTATLLYVRKRRENSHTLTKKRVFRTISREIKGVKKFSFVELSDATNGFDSSTLIGRGSYGKVYKGILSNKTEVAIKRGEETSLQSEKEFLNEIDLLSRLHHRNLVSLIGYSSDIGEQMLVYEYMPNGNVRDWLSANATDTLSFSMRSHVRTANECGTVLSVADSRMGQCSPDKVKKLAELALWCCEDRPETRPPMSKVVKELEGICQSVREPEMFSETTKLLCSKTSPSSSSVPSPLSLLPGSNLDSGFFHAVKPR